MDEMLGTYDKANRAFIVEREEFRRITGKPNVRMSIRRLRKFYPDRPPLTGLPRINTTPFTDAQRKRFQPKKVKKIKPFAPTVQKVKEIVPNKMIPKLKPMTPPTY